MKSSQPTKGRRVEELDVLRGIAVALMLVGHAIAKENLPSYDAPLPAIFNAIYTFHMPLFFLISGLCYSYQPGTYPAYLAKKARRLVVPYICFALFAFLLRFVFPAFSLSNYTPLQTLLRTALKGGENWFLYVLFFCFVIHPGLLRLLNTPLKAVCGAAVIWLAHLLIPQNNWLCSSSFLFHYPFFLLGTVLKAPVLRWLTDREAKARNATAILALLAADLLLAWFKSGIETTAGQILIHIVQAVLGIGISILLVTLIHWKPVASILKALGQHSLELYLFNGYFVSVSRTFCGMAHLGTPIVVAMNLMFVLVFNYIWVYWVTKIRPVRWACGLS